jgi:hypothetical protein
MRKGKSVAVIGEEATAYEALCEWSRRDEPLRFILAVPGARPVDAADLDPQRWLVPTTEAASLTLWRTFCSASYFKIGSKASEAHGS